MNCADFAKTDVMKKHRRCPPCYWELQKISVLPQRELRFVFPHPWKNVTDFSGLYKIEFTCRCDETVMSCNSQKQCAHESIKTANESTKNTVKRSVSMHWVQDWIFKNDFHAAPASGHQLQGFVHPRWLFGISSINSIACTQLWTTIKLRPWKQAKSKKETSIPTINCQGQKCFQGGYP